MGRSLSLSAYLAYARRTSGPPTIPDQLRPQGELVWCHAVDTDRVDALLQLTKRLVHQRPGITMLLTTQENITPLVEPAEAVIWQPLPEDSLVAAETFLAHWTPQLCLWTGGNLQPAIISCVDKRNIPMFLIDAEEGLLIRPSWRWIPDLPRALMQRFSHIFARSANTARALRRIGASDTKISITGPMSEGAVALTYNESDREELAELLRSRPVWLASRMDIDELEIILAAHRIICKLAHRTVLVIAPDDPDQAPAIRERLTQEGWRFVDWSESQLPGETTQVILADSPDELGLWYLLSPITFMGNSLVDGQSGRDPNEPAAHGSAILYGPHMRRYMATYSRFVDAGAARIVRDQDTLAFAVQNLIAPDRSAAMARSAWEVASEGASVTDQIIELVQDSLDSWEGQE